MTRNRDAEPLAPPAVPATDSRTPRRSHPIAQRDLPALVAVCESCGRKLTDDTSRGYGPDCWRAQHPQQQRRRTVLVAATRIPAGLIPGQTEIDITDEEHAD